MGKRGRRGKEKPAEPSRFRSATLLTFLENHAGWIAIAAILFASARIVATYNVYSHTGDEPAHIACGLEWLDHHIYRWEPQHPPLARVAAAIGPYLLGAHSREGNPADQDAMVDEGVRILYSGNHYDLSLFLARLACLPFFWVAAVVVYEWGRRYYSRAVAALSVCVFTFLPAVLAHAGLATTDMALTAFLGAAFLTGMMWLEQPTAARAAAFGLCGGLALLSKFSSMVFFPATAALALLCYFAVERPSRARVLRAIRQRGPTLAISAGVCFFVVWAGYRFSVGPVPVLGNRTLPFPELFAGIQQVRDHNEHGHFSYLLGQRGQFGWWYFFPVALAVKTPLAFLILLLAGVFATFRKKSPVRRAWLPGAFAAAILIAGMASTINIGLRHILPVYIGFSIVVGLAVNLMLERAPEHRGMLGAGVLLLAWFAGSSILSHPDYLPYFNLLAGSHPENVLVDSDLDWGQDLKRLAKRLQEAGAPELTLSTGFRIDYAKTGLPPRIDRLTVLYPPPGWCAVSVSYWKERRLGLLDRYPQYTLFPDRIPPTEKVGKGIFLWYTPPASAVSTSGGE